MSLSSNDLSEKILEDIENYVNLINNKLETYRAKLDKNHEMEIFKLNEKFEILEKKKNFFRCLS